MTMFNQQGKEFTYKVEIDRDPKIDPTYTHPFPVMIGNKIQERWSTKVRPIKSLTRVLQGVQLKRNKDYMIDFNTKTQKYEYWFEDGQTAMMFSLMAGHMKQLLAPPGQIFNIECPHCRQQFSRQDIIWC